MFRWLAATIVVLAVAQAAAAQSYKVPRTPWGDPDLQGTYSNSNEYATPLERPARFEGRRIEDITPAEMAQIRQAAEQQAVDGLAPGPRPKGRTRPRREWEKPYPLSTSSASR